jgi:hypothetical protein
MAPGGPFRPENDKSFLRHPASGIRRSVKGIEVKAKVYSV